MRFPRGEFFIWFCAHKINGWLMICGVSNWVWFDVFVLLKLNYFSLRQCVLGHLCVWFDNRLIIYTVLVRQQIQSVIYSIHRVYPLACTMCELMSLFCMFIYMKIIWLPYVLCVSAHIIWWRPITNIYIYPTSGMNTAQPSKRT